MGCGDDVGSGANGLGGAITSGVISWGAAMATVLGVAAAAGAATPSGAPHVAQNRDPTSLRWPWPHRGRTSSPQIPQKAAPRGKACPLAQLDIDPPNP